MRRLFTALAATALLATAPGCSTLSSPAPFAQTQVDEKAFIIALKAFDTLLSAVDALQLTPGTPKALRLADAIDKGRVAFDAAGAAHRAGSTTSYVAALLEAREALVLIKELIQ